MSGDTAKTAYYSQPTTSKPSVGVPAFNQTIGSSTRTQSTGSMTSFFTSAQNVASGANANGAIIPITAINTVDEFVPTPNQTVQYGTYFRIGTDITQTVASNSYATGLLGALDLFRVLHSASGATLTAGLSQGNNAVVGAGQYIGTLTLSNTGNLSIGSLTAVPEPSALGLTGLLTASGLLLRSRRTRPAQLAS